MDGYVRMVLVMAIEQKRVSAMWYTKAVASKQATQAY
jgi:hypothetical protein